MVVVEADVEVREVALVLHADARDQLLGRDAQLAGLEHDGRAVGVVGADEDAVVAGSFWKRTQMSVWMYSTMWPRWMGPLA